MATTGTTRNGNPAQRMGGKAKQSTAGDRRGQAKKLIEELLTVGKRVEWLAVELYVNVATIARWRKGERAPQPGAMARLQALHARVLQPKGKP